MTSTSNVDYEGSLVMDHFRSPRNMGTLKDANAEATIGNPSCGDVMKIMLRIEGKKIVDVKFQTMGCAAAIATSSIATEMVKGKNLDYAKKLTSKDVADALGKLPAIKHHCSNLASDALHKAIENWEGKK